MCNSTLALRLVTTSAATALVLASSGFGALFAYNAGIPHGLPLAILSVVFAVSLEVIKPLAVSAAISAFMSWSVIRGALLAVLSLVAIAYSLTAELSLMAGSRSDLAANRQSQITQADRQNERYTTAKKELAALAPSRLAGEIQADLDRTGHPARISKLEAELARAERRSELQKVLEAPATTTVSTADPASTALALYLSLFGYTIAVETLSQLLYLVPVLALELGSALSVVLVQAVTLRKEPSLVLNEPSESLALGQPNRLYTRDEVAKRVMNHLMTNGGSLLRSERSLADLLGSDRNTTRRALQGLADAKLIECQPTKKGTALKLVS